MKYSIILLYIIILLSCNNKQINKNILIEENNIFILNQSDNSQQSNSVFYKLENNEDFFRFGNMAYGIIYNTIINNDVNVYLLPSFNSRVKDELIKGTRVQIIGISDLKETLENNDVHWVKIYYGTEDIFPQDPKTGWILSNSTTLERCYLSNLEIEKTDGNERGLVLYGKYYLNNLIMEFSVSTHKLENQDFYTFSWDYSKKGFHYSNKMGLYIWNDNTKELRHISYVGGQGSKWGFSSWAIVTDDFKYMLQDQGTDIPPRRVVIWSLENGEEIFSAKYYDISLKGYLVEIVKFYKEHYDGKWSEHIESNLNDIEINFAKNFINKNDPYEYFEELPNSFAMLIVYDYNIETKEIKILSGKYCPTH